MNKRMAIGYRRKKLTRISISPNWWVIFSLYLSLNAINHISKRRKTTIFMCVGVFFFYHFYCFISSHSGGRWYCVWMCMRINAIKTKNSILIFRDFARFARITVNRNICTHHTIYETTRSGYNVHVYGNINANDAVHLVMMPTQFDTVHKRNMHSPPDLYTLAKNYRAASFFLLHHNGSEPGFELQLGNEFYY